MSYAKIELDRLDHDDASESEANFTPVDIAFKDICYRVPTPDGETQILRSVSGYVPAGKMLAIMGPSGSGKTSLLDVLAGRTKEGQVDGFLTVSGQPRPANFMQMSGYVMQDSAFLENMTVRETIRDSLRFRNDPACYEGKEEEIVQNIIDVMRLKKVADSKIGDPLSYDRISGGEQRRLAIAIEMVVSPAILFMDEPTSGLDAISALRIMGAMQMLCRRGHTIVTTIHQPRSDIYKMFDYLLLLYAGETIYYGPADGALPYFTKLGYTCPDSVNPADFLLDMLDDEVDKDHTDTHDEEFGDSDSEEEKDDIDTRVIIKAKDAVEKADFGDAFLKSGEGKNLEKLTKNIDKNPGACLSKQKIKHDFPISLWQQFVVLFFRSWRVSLRDKSVLYIRTGAGIGIGLLVGTIFFGQKDEPSSMGARLNSQMFMMCIFSLFCLPAIGKYLREKLHFLRERASGFYSTGPYFFATQAVEVPLLTIIVLIYSNITYWMIGLEPRAENYFYLITTVFVVVNSGFAVSQLISSVVNSPTMGLALYFIFLVYCLLLGGFIVHVDMMPGPIQNLIYTSYFFYGFQGLIVNEFEHKDYGHGVILGLDFNGADKWVDLAILWAFWMTVLTCTFLSLRFFNKEKR